MIEVNLDDKILEIFEESKREYIKNKILNIVSTATKMENLGDKNIYVSITAVTNEEIKALNNEYRGINKDTDVLSFPVFEKEDLINNFVEMELGDIFLCLNIIKKQAIEYETGLERELLYMITHGICHLLGYDHIDDSDKLIMRKKEEEILNKGVTNENK